MKRAVVLVSAALALAFCGATQAQLYRWVDKDGKVRYGDTPPAGAKTTKIQAPPPVAAPQANPAAKAPTRPSEPDFRSAQTKARQAAEKGSEDEKKKAEARAACDKAKAQLSTLQESQRTATRGNLDELQRAVAAQQQAVQRRCS